MFTVKIEGSSGKVTIDEAESVELFGGGCHGDIILHKDGISRVCNIPPGGNYVDVTVMNAAGVTVAEHRVWDDRRLNG